MKVVVIGAGIVGLLTACRLKQQGADVVVLEKGSIGKESSWAGAGILCPIHPWLYPDSFSSLVNTSLALYDDLDAELQSSTGIDMQRMKSGLLIPCFADDKQNHEEKAVSWSKAFDWQLEILSATQAGQHEPSLSTELNQALFWPDVYQVRNPELLKAVQALLQSLEVPIIEQAEVVALNEDSSGQVMGVFLLDGTMIDGDAVLFAAGSWSQGLAEQSGFTLPVLPVKGQIVLVQANPENTLNHIVKHDDAYFVPRRDGKILVGASMENVGFSEGNTVKGVHSLLSAVLKLVPGLSDCAIERQWMGFRPGSPDGLPFLGPIEGKRGLWVATGHYRNGVALAPITANVMASWILGESPKLDMAAFSPQRTIVPNKELGYPKA
ncbi:MAG: glycine oxidase ThiO [Zetaproteobacteria bacterium CG2_30_46_52]|nr:MAG: glycine oxidase ThiO [Zetaproteobacteria bacterium CG2_30_46_52]